MFLLEALVLALAGVAAGFVVGSAAAWAISEGNFHTATLPHLSVLPMVLLLNVVIAALAALLPCAGAAWVAAGCAAEGRMRG